MFLVLKKYIINKEAVVYMDDVILFSKDKELHYRIIHNVLNRLSEFGLIINYSKCTFIKSEIDFLGFNITENQIRPNSDKQKFFENLGTPDTVKELHSLSGMFNYFRGFVPNYSSKMKLIFDMINKKIPFDKN